MAAKKVLCVCDVCGAEVMVVIYNVHKWTRCRTCANSATGKANLGKKRTPEQNRVNSEVRKGNKNHFYGKTHTDEAKEKIRAKNKNRILSEEEKEIKRQILSKHGNRRHFYDIWVEKYGLEEANRKREEVRLKQIENSSGKNNLMYGKPSPQGSGNGWSGWFRGIFFRSILEMSYLKNLFENGIRFESGELKKHSVSYIDYKGDTRNYFPDFYLIDLDEHIEIKPERLTKTPSNSIKFETAKLRFKKFSVLTEKDIKIVSPSEMKDLYFSGDIKWTERYEQKFKERYLE